MVIMSNRRIAYQAIQIPQSGTFVLVPEEEMIRASDALEIITFLTLPKLEELTSGFLLKHHREAAGLTQEQLEQKSGVGQKHISNIEKGLITPRLPTLEKMFPYLDKKFERAILYLWNRQIQVESA